MLEVVLSEREERRPTPELVWTGPAAPAGTARDTAVVLRELFEARERASFSRATTSITPGRCSRASTRAMRDHRVDARFFVDVPQMERGASGEAHLATHLGKFIAESWPFGDPRPRLYYDLRALLPGPPYCSLHAKCVVVDGARAFVSSANFTQRGQERNIEVGVLIEDATADFPRRAVARPYRGGDRRRAHRIVNSRRAPPMMRTVWLPFTSPPLARCPWYAASLPARCGRRSDAGTRH